jgi:hypothetical protein
MSSITDFLMSLCNWIDNSLVGHGVRDSVWLFPFVEIFHLIGLSILGGACLIINFRLLGLIFPKQPVAELAKDLYKWMVTGLVLMLISGSLLFSSESVKMYGNWAFRAKMSALLVAILFTFTVYRKTILSETNTVSPLNGKLLALVSIVLWSAVGLAGRAIGYVP